MFLRFFYEFLIDQIVLTKEQMTIGSFWVLDVHFEFSHLNI